MRNWPALEVGRLTRATPDAPDLLQAALVDYQVAAIAKSTPDTWHIFFDSAGERDRAADALAQQFLELSIAPVDVPDEDWVARSQADLRAVRVGNIVVAPPWDVPQRTSWTTRRIRLDNASSSSGRRWVSVPRTTRPRGSASRRSSASTRAAREVIDVGTGSGVLAIAASRLGAVSVVGIDDDPDALQAAEDNLTLNRGADVTLTTADLRTASPGTFDLVTANLTGALLIEAAGRLRDLANPGGRLVLSGFLRHEEAGVMAAYSECAVTTRLEEEEWVCVSLQRP